MSPPSKRLGKSDWTDAGLRALEEEGFTAVRAEILAKKLGVSRGSFYWHFKDIAAFETALIARWRDLVLGALDAPLAVIEPATERFRELMRRSLMSERKVETAMRAWGTVNPRISTALAAIDIRRLKYMEKLIADTGASKREARARACIAYWSYLGRAMTTTPNGKSEIDAVLDELVRMLT